MASSVLAEPGTKYGPCLTLCEHRDCIASRKLAASACLLCGDPIGWDRHYYDYTGVEGSGYVHAACYENAVEKELRRYHRHYSDHCTSSEVADRVHASIDHTLTNDIKRTT